MAVSTWLLIEVKHSREQKKYFFRNVGNEFGTNQPILYIRKASAPS